VVSAVTRAIRSPGSLRSTAGMRSHTRWGDQAAPGVQDHRLSGTVQHVAAQRADSGVGQRQDGKPQQRPRHRPVPGEVVDQPLGGQRQGQAHGAGRKAQQATADQGEAVGPRVGEQDPPGRCVGRLRLVVLRPPVRQPITESGGTGFVQGRAAGVSVWSGVHGVVVILADVGVWVRWSRTRLVAMLATSRAAQPGYCGCALGPCRRVGSKDAVAGGPSALGDQEGAGP
jgi:hypothetical protein